MGDIDTKSHTVKSKGRVVYNSGTEFFERTASKERFKTNRFMELVLDYSIDESNRDAARKINRLRLENKGISAATYRNTVEHEGLEMQVEMNEKCAEALSNNGFNRFGELIHGKEFTPNKPQYIEQAVIEAAAIERSIWEYDALDYESLEETVNVSIDDVGVKRQTETRPGDKEKQAKTVRNTVLHVEMVSKSKRKNYIVNTDSIVSGIRLLIGLLLTNGLLGKQIVIFADGARDIHTAVQKMLAFANFKIILDWYHLEKKCKEQLSMALKNSKIRNEFLENGFMKCLWHGNIDGAIKLLQDINPAKIKNNDYITKLIEYFERVRGYVPCYGLRKELGLRNSSNLGEKSNDIIVSDRQKHQGMSWSNDGSIAFATVATTSHNRELQQWIHHRTISFELQDAVA